MATIEDIIKEIHEAFGNNEYPGDGFLQGSFEGCEPYDEVGAFKGKRDWRTVDPEFLDGHASALSFFYVRALASIPGSDDACGMLWIAFVGTGMLIWCLLALVAAGHAIFLGARPKD